MFVLITQYVHTYTAPPTQLRITIHIHQSKSIDVVITTPFITGSVEPHFGCNNIVGLNLTAFDRISN